ncbi:transmembrane protein 186 [Leptodactylus fuscus]|uniref:transmembrane protein 186 n=1 Tax=Leptodactylus fuscus TaxID=238119 RepID=UPI003F4F16B6
MAQLIVRSPWLRPLCHFSVQLWKSNALYRTSFIGCGRISSTNKKPQIASTSLFCTASPINTDGKTDDSTKYKMIYKFPAIRFCRTLSRLKLVQTAMTALILPPVYYYYLQGQITQLSVIYCTGTALFAGTMLYALSAYLRRIIGMLYVDDDLTTVKVSHLTFWGNRKNIFVPIDDVKPLSETGDNRREILRQFARYSNSDILYFTTRYGFVLDREKFTKVFGELK